jgi:hypothetical protein
MPALAVRQVLRGVGVVLLAISATVVVDLAALLAWAETWGPGSAHSSACSPSRVCSHSVPQHCSLWRGGAAAATWPVGQRTRPARMTRWTTCWRYGSTWERAWGGASLSWERLWSPERGEWTWRYGSRARARGDTHGCSASSLPCSPGSRSRRGTLCSRAYLPIPHSHYASGYSTWAYWRSGS